LKLSAGDDRLEAPRERQRLTDHDLERIGCGAEVAA